jgi:hypothetical protein
METDEIVEACGVWGVEGGGTYLEGFGAETARRETGFSTCAWV